MDYAQPTGLLLGYYLLKDCGFNARVVPTEPLLDKIGILYDELKIPEGLSFLMQKAKGVETKVPTLV